MPRHLLVARVARVLPVLVASVGVIAACSTETVTKEVIAPATPGAPQDEPPEAGPVADAAAKVDAATPKTRPPITFPHVQSRGGRLIKAPRVMPIVFSGDAMIPNITAFTAKLAGSDYWKTQAAEYGVGDLTAVATHTSTTAAPDTIGVKALEAWLATNLSGATPELGAPDESTLYAIYYPANTTVTDDGTGLGTSCDDYGGYHSETTVAGKAISYAVLPRCGDVDALTVASSHETFEWATDPLPMTNPAFNKLDDAHWAWGITMLGELADLCTFLDRDNLRPPELGFEVQRFWSNQASLAGKYPCAPTKTVAYLQAITDADDDIEVPDPAVKGATLMTKGIVIAPGKSRTVSAVIYSDQSDKPVVPLRAISQADFDGTSKPSGFTFSLSADHVKVGDNVQVTIQAPKDPGFDILVMTAYASAQEAHYWPVLVVADDSAAARQTRPAVTPAMAARWLDAKDARASHARRPSTMLGTRSLRAAP